MEYQNAGSKCVELVSGTKVQARITRDKDGTHSAFISHARVGRKGFKSQAAAKLYIEEYIFGNKHRSHL